LAAVIEGTNIGTWEWNVLTGETVFNRRWAEMVGYTLEELEPINIQTWLELVHPDDLALSESELERHFAGEIEHYDVQCRMRHKDGHWIWVHDRGRVVTRTEDGKPLMMYGTHADISKQKHAESELNQFKNTLDGTLDCVFMFDAESLRFNYFNEGALQQIGYDREELLQMHPYDIKPDFTPRQFRELIAPLLNGQQVSITFETVHRRKDGRQWPVEVFLQYVAPANEPARFVAIVRDLTERKEAEAERERIANLLSNVLDAASEVSIIATDLQGTITVFNSGAERMLGYAAEQMIGRTTPALIHLESEVIQRATELSGELGRPVSGFEVFVAHAKQGRSERREWTYVRRDGGHLTVSLVVTAVRDSRGQITGFLGVAEDISERKRRDAALRAAKEAAESASQAKGEFLANMSHELRTPLNAVIGFSEGLLERTNRHPLNDHQKDRLAKIHKSGHHLLSLINDVLDISKIESGKVELYPSTFDLRSLAEEVADISVGAFREKSNVRFQLLLDDGLPQLCSDREKIKQILINLVGNALKFTHQGQVTMNVQQRDDRLLITVQDTGIGIPADQLEKIFDKFHQIRGSISDSVKGTGLGLSICKMLSDLLGATLSMESTVGSGSIVTLSLPANAGSAPGESLSSGKHVVTT
jgi:PAS domain S-box-containing protein